MPDGTRQSKKLIVKVGVSVCAGIDILTLTFIEKVAPFETLVARSTFNTFEFYERYGVVLSDEVIVALAV